MVCTLKFMSWVIATTWLAVRFTVYENSHGMPTPQKKTNRPCTPNLNSRETLPKVHQNSSVELLTHPTAKPLKETEERIQLFHWFVEKIIEFQFSEYCTKKAYFIYIRVGSGCTSGSWVRKAANALSLKTNSISWKQTNIQLCQLLRCLESKKPEKPYPQEDQRTQTPL